MPGYLEVELNEFQNPKHSQPQDSPDLWTDPKHVSTSQLNPLPDTTPTLLPEKCT